MATKINNKTNRMYNILLVGDHVANKTRLLFAHKKGRVDPSFEPKVFDPYAETLNIDGNEITLALFDTAGLEEYEKPRIISYGKTDVCLMCFSVDNIDSFNNITSKWLPEVKKYCPRAFKFLIGTNAELRDDSNPANMVTKAMGEKLAKDYNMQKYLECSAIKMAGVHEVFEEAARTLLYTKRVKSECLLL